MVAQVAAVVSVPALAALRAQVEFLMHAGHLQVDIVAARVAVGGVRIAGAVPVAQTGQRRAVPVRLRRPAAADRAAVPRRSRLRRQKTASAGAERADDDGVEHLRDVTIDEPFASNRLHQYGSIITVRYVTIYLTCQSRMEIDAILP